MSECEENANALYSRIVDYTYVNSPCHIAPGEEAGSRQTLCTGCAIRLLNVTYKSAYTPSFMSLLWIIFSPGVQYREFMVMEMMYERGW